ncbi:hypothetical protein JTB14_035900 [Gonioctena quinquepunctata]|nr:hypothetical protein JTB14_035900 [Gonioctena quinquepunctata]
MARYSSRHARKLLYSLLLLFVAPSRAEYLDETAPVFTSIKQKPPVEYEDYKKIGFEVRGKNLHGVKIKATKSILERGVECQDLNQFDYNISEINTLEFYRAQFELTVPNNVQGNIYLCSLRRIKQDTGPGPVLFRNVIFKWFSQGHNVTLNVNSTGQQKFAGYDQSRP